MGSAPFNHYWDDDSYLNKQAAKAAARVARSAAKAKAWGMPVTDMGPQSLTRGTDAGLFDREWVVARQVARSDTWARMTGGGAKALGFITGTPAAKKISGAVNTYMTKAGPTPPSMNIPLMVYDMASHLALMKWQQLKQAPFGATAVGSKASVPPS